MPSLRQGLDRDVYQVVRKFEDENDGAKVTISAVYEYVQRSNSSLKRQKKRLLEDSIERVLDLRRDEARADKDSDEELEKELQARAASAKRSREEKDASLMNRQLTKHWNFRGSNNDSPDTSAAVNTDRQPNGEARPKRRRKDKESRGLDRSPPQDITLADLAGLDVALRELHRSVFIPLRYTADLDELGYRPSDGVILHGPSGCGKTTLAHALAAELGVAFIPVSTPSLVGGTSGESEKNIRDIFDEALRLAPCLVFFDELDSIAGKKDSAQKAMEGRIVTELCHGMDRIGRRGASGGAAAIVDDGGLVVGDAPAGNVVVLAATNRPDFIDPTVRRRFGVEVDIGMPNEPAREKILRSMTRDLALAEDVDFAALSRLTPGYVGADLRHVISAAVSEAVEARISQRSELFLQQPNVPDVFLVGDEDDTAAAAAAVTTNITITANTTSSLTSSQRRIRLAEASKDVPIGPARITMAHLTRAISTVQPAVKREGFSAIPDTTWAHVGALTDVRKKLEMTIIGPIKYPARFARVGIKPAAGILLWGPPGCGKTLVAKAVANESKANFISIKGPELLNKYVGESERAVRSLFARARSSAPCILFFDEMDALAPKRDDSLSDASSRVVNALLTELDGVGDRGGIYVVGATNRPDCIDPAIRRPGRLGTSVFVGLPAAEDRVAILRTIYCNTIAAALPGGGEGDGARAAAAREAIFARLRAIALDRRCEGFSGADLGNLMQAAAQASLERIYYHGGGDISMEANAGEADDITAADWERALNEVKPSVKDDGRYDPRQFDNA